MNRRPGCGEGKGGEIEVDRKFGGEKSNREKLRVGEASKILK